MFIKCFSSPRRTVVLSQLYTTVAHPSVSCKLMTSVGCFNYNWMANFDVNFEVIYPSCVSILPFSCYVIPRYKLYIVKVWDSILLHFDMIPDMRNPVILIIVLLSRCISARGDSPASDTPGHWRRRFVCVDSRISHCSATVYKIDDPPGINSTIRSDYIIDKSWRLSYTNTQTNTQSRCHYCVSVYKQGIFILYVLCES